jgi:flagellar assembly protein FliH
LSSLLRAESVAVLEHRPFGLNAAAPQMIGGHRLLREHQVGIEVARPLLVPVTARAVEAARAEQADALASPADFSELEEAARLRGYNEGYERGLMAGHAAAEEHMAESISRLAQLAHSIHENHAGFFRAAERQVVDLALQIAQKVVEREVENMPDMAIGVIRSALEEMDGRTAVRIRVSPDDEELLRRRWAQVVPPGIGPERIELQSDERIKSGGAVIETTQGQVDAQLETKLAQLGNALWTFVMEVNTAKDAEEDAGA